MDQPAPQSQTVIYAGLTDAAVVAEIGRRVRAERLNQNITQAALGERASVDRQTVASLEKGTSTSLASLVAIVRGLGRLETLESFLPPHGPSPIAVLNNNTQPRERASRRPPASPFAWGDT